MKLNVILLFLAFCSAVGAVRIVMSFEGPESVYPVMVTQVEAKKYAFSRPMLSELPFDAEAARRFDEKQESGGQLSYSAGKQYIGW